MGSEVKLVGAAGWLVTIIYEDGEIENQLFEDVEQLNDLIAAGTSDEAYQYGVGIQAYTIDEAATAIQVDSWHRQA